MILSSSMLQQIMFPFKPLCTFGAIPLSQAWQIFSSLACLVLGEVFGRFQICIDLIKISTRSINILNLRETDTFQTLTLYAA